jgi:hypothetical protein
MNIQTNTSELCSTTPIPSLKNYNLCKKKVDASWTNLHSPGLMCEESQGIDSDAYSCQEDVCPICIIPFTNFSNNDIFTTSCNHNFCKICISEITKNKIRISENKLCFNCPLCRKNVDSRLFNYTNPLSYVELLTPIFKEWSFDESKIIDILERKTIEYQYSCLSQVLKTQNSINLKLSEELIFMVKFILLAKKKQLLNFLIENPNLQPEFIRMYEQKIKNHVKYFVKIDNIYIDFALSWLLYLYH